jgi:hypothetical protein
MRLALAAAAALLCTPAIAATTWTVETKVDKFDNKTTVRAPSGQDVVAYTSGGEPGLQFVAKYKGTEARGTPSVELQMLYRSNRGIECGRLVMLVDGKRVEMDTKQKSPVPGTTGQLWVYFYPSSVAFAKRLASAKTVEAKFCEKEFEVLSDFRETWQQAFGM